MVRSVSVYVETRNTTPPCVQSQLGSHIPNLKVICSTPNISRPRNAKLKSGLSCAKLREIHSWSFTSVYRIGLQSPPRKLLILELSHEHIVHQVKENRVFRQVNELMRILELFLGTLQGCDVGTDGSQCIVNHRWLRELQSWWFKWCCSCETVVFRRVEGGNVSGVLDKIVLTFIAIYNLSELSHNYFRCILEI